MRRALTVVLTVLVAALVPPLLVTTSLRIVVNDWIVHFEYAAGRVPDDRLGLSRDERTELALTGLRSIQPGQEEGVALLRAARLPDGRAAFGAREVSHMQDVRDLVRVLLAFQLWATAALAALALTLAVPRSTRGLVPRALRVGVVAAVLVAVLVGLMMAVAWERFFAEFHHLFFTGDTWLFRTSDTLIRLYPDAFWVGVAAWLAGLTVLLAALVWVASTLWLRAVRL